MARRGPRRRRIAAKVLVVVIGVVAVSLVGLRLAGQRSLQRALERSATEERTLPPPAAAKEPDSDAAAAAVAARVALAQLECTPEEASAVAQLAHRPRTAVTDDERTLVAGAVMRNRDSLERLTALLGAGPVGPLWESPASPAPAEMRRELVEAQMDEIEAFGTEVTLASRLLTAAARVEATSNPSSAAARLAALARLGESLEGGDDALSTGLGLCAEHLALRAGLELLAASSAADEGVLHVVERLPVGVTVDVMVHHVIASWRERLGRMLNPPPSPSDDERTFGQRVLGVVVWPTLRAFSMAAAVEMQTDLIELVGTSYGVEPARFEEPPRPPWWRLDRRMALIAMPNLRGLIRRGQLVAAERQLLGAAVAMRRRGLERGSYPAERPSLPVLDEPDPYTGRPVEYEVFPDGRLRLAVAGGEALTADMMGAYRGALAPVLLPVPWPRSVASAADDDGSGPLPLSLSAAPGAGHRRCP